MATEWRPLTVEQVAERFAGFDVDWWIAGGQAIDLFLGWQTRYHDDLDVEMFRSDFSLLFDIFSGWELHAVSEGERSLLRRGDQLDPAIFGIWGRVSASDPWSVEVILANGDMKRWRFRRDPDISLPGELLVRHTHAGIPYCATEVQLLYKSKQARQKDDADLAMVLHKMSGSQRSWLASAIRRSDTEHPWVSVLENANESHRD